MRLIPKEIETLWTLFTAPVVWAAHFLVCYIGAAVYCAKPELVGLSFSAVRAGIAAATVIALSLIALSAWLAWRQWGFGTDDPPHDDPTRRDRSLFQGFATLLLSGLSFIAVIFTAMPALFLTECIR
jgi:Kef-type K+ transport system membrane component KefB